MSVDPGSRGWNDHRHRDPGAPWHHFVPIAKQGVALSFTTLMAKWTQTGKTVHVQMTLQFTSAGTAAQFVTVGLPTGTPVPKDFGTWFVIGVMNYAGATPAEITGNVWADTESAGYQFTFMPHGSSSGLLGQNGETVASGHVLGFTAMYETASEP